MFNISTLKETVEQVCLQLFLPARNQLVHFILSPTFIYDETKCNSEASSYLLAPLTVCGYIGYTSHPGVTQTGNIETSGRCLRKVLGHHELLEQLQ